MPMVPQLPLQPVHRHSRERIACLHCSLQSFSSCPHYNEAMAEAFFAGSVRLRLHQEERVALLVGGCHDSRQSLCQGRTSSRMRVCKAGAQILLIVK